MGMYTWLSFGMFLAVLTQAESGTTQRQLTKPLAFNKTASSEPVTSRQVIEKASKSLELKLCHDYLKEARELAANSTRYTGPEPSPISPDSIKAVYQKDNITWTANISWESPKENADALTKYVVYYGSFTNDPFISYCEELPKDQPFKVIQEHVNVWKYPDDLYVTVIALPNSTYLNQDLYFKTLFSYEIPEIPPFPPTQLVKKEGESNPQIPVIVGVFCGVLILAVMVVIYRRRKRPPHVEEFETVQVQATKKPQNIDTFFASYLPESEKYSNEVATILYKLGTMGYKVVFDQVDSVRMNEIGFNMWVDKQILETKKCIVFCTPGYVRLWQSLTTTALDTKLGHVNKEDLVRVRYEIKRISDVYSENCSTSRIVCIKMDPKMNTKLLPPWMNHNMLLWPEQKDDVIRRLNDQAAMVMHV